MLSLCKRVHTFLGFPDPDDRCRSIHHHRCRNIPSTEGAGLRCITGQIHGSAANVVGSAAIGSRPPPPQSEERIDDGTRGSNDYLYDGDQHGSGGLGLCTESLGFESSCDGRMGQEERAEQEIRKMIEEGKRRSSRQQEDEEVVTRSRKSRSRRTTEAKKFPPPLPWLPQGGANGGRSTSFLRAVRKDGRFLLTEVRFERPEILRASRQDGRLRLQLIRPEEVKKEEEDVQEKVEAVEDEEVLGKEEVRARRRWQLPPSEREGGGFRSGRCQEVVSESISSPFWNTTRFVTTA